MVARMVRMPANALTAVALAVVCGSICRGVEAEPPIVLAGITGGVCATQFQKCTARCSGSGVCTHRCVANDRACRVGGKPIFR
jgi:NaMN:DMB phosphoribosyltransferase